MTIFENKPFDEIAIGDTADLTRVLTKEDIALFAAMSGNVNPTNLDPDYANASPFEDVIGHGMWSGSLISTVLGTRLPGAGTVYLGQTLRFKRPVRLGDTVTARVAVKEKRERGRVVLNCEVVNADGEQVIDGEAFVMAPMEKLTVDLAAAPKAVLHEQGDRLRALISKAEPGAPLKTGVVHPVNAISIEGALAARDANLIAPVFYGPKAKIEAAARQGDYSLSDIEIVDCSHSHAAAETAAKDAAAGRISALMKGALHTDEIMSQVVSRAVGLRTERRVSHVFVIDTPAYDRLLMISDAAINIAPDLSAKRDIVQNAIDLCIALGVATPKVAVLSAVETVYPKMTSTLDAAALCKMSDRGQITGGVVDGPLAFDNAISSDAAKAKGISSPVAGVADILVAPDIEAGNMMAKQLDYLGGAVAAGVVLGARVPVILTSRAEGALPRLASSAVAKLYALGDKSLKL
ncbi:MAG: bifunctional enoyl-CoA hydratase/phosphate acetyltransferase [Pseudomonadota bacterium]